MHPSPPPCPSGLPCRYETNLLNTAAQALDFLEVAGHHPNIYVHLDTYHMNVSGQGLSAGGASRKALLGCGFGGLT